MRFPFLLATGWLIFPSLFAQDAPQSVPAARAWIQAVTSESASFVPAPAIAPAEERSANFVVNYTGFSAEAQAAFQHAVNIWGSLITSDVPIVIDATWEDLPGNTLGSAGATALWYNFGGAPVNDLLYPSPLADKLAGVDLEPGSADMVANFDSGTDWYFGLDGNPPFGQYDLVSVVLHEIGHGLGFAGTMYVGVDLNGYVLNGSLAHVYDDFVYTGNNEAVLDFGNGTAALADALQGDNLYWAGINANNNSGPFSPKLYAPAFWEQGSSLSHFDEATYPAGNIHSLMTPAIGNGEAVHSPGPMALGLLEDIGWTVDYDALDAVVDVFGCNDENACNYDPAATVFDGSCVYPVADEPCGDCVSSWSMSANLAAGASETFEFGGVGALYEVTFHIVWAGEQDNGEWLSDLLIVLCDPNGDCVEWGGYDLSFGAEAAGLEWPEEWETTTPGYYIVTLDLSELDLSGLGTWSVTLMNGYAASTGLDLTDVLLDMPYLCPLDDLVPGCTDEAACNYEPEADYNDGSCTYFCFTCTTTLIQDNFQSYNELEPLTVQSDGPWVTWSGESGGEEDPLVVFDGFDGAVQIIPGVEQNTDLYLPIGATEGEHFVQFAIDVEPGNGAYYNVQGQEAPGIEWALEVYIDAEGEYTFIQGTDTAVASGFQSGQDQVLSHLFDLDNDELRILNGENLVALLDYPGDLGGVNFYATMFDATMGAYLLDDVTVCETSTEEPGCTDSEACNFDPEAVVDDGSCWTPEDYGWCDCEGNLLDAVGDCGGDCAADVDGDGLCDDEDDCIGGEPDECGVCDGPGAIYECGCSDIPEGDCDCFGNQLDALGVCGGDCEADVDGDGVCDVPGCTDPEACNYDAGANTDDGSCQYPPVFYDCAGACLNDADGDGVCDELEVEGCTDEEACNFDEAATDDDASCAYLYAEVISGNTAVTAGNTQLYTASPSDPANTYTWVVNGGSILSGQGTAIVTIEWTTEGSHPLQVIETNAACNGDLLQLDVTVSPIISVEEQAWMSWNVVPNPAADWIRMEGLPDGTTVGLRLFHLDGRLISEWRSVSNGMRLPLEGVASGGYLLEARWGDRRTVRPLLRN